MDIDPVVARLKVQLTTLKSIGGAADMDSAIEGAVALPAAFVLPLAESGSPMGGASTNHETHVLAFGVVHVVSNRRDAIGAAALTDLATLRTALKAALVGWVPDATNGEPVHFSSGRLMNLDANGRLWWLDEFHVNKPFWSN